MTRPTQSKILYVVTITILTAFGIGLVFFSPFNKQTVLICTVVAFLIPGRIQGVAFRAHFRGRRLLAAGEYEAAIMEFERFLDQLHAQPWRRHFVWLAWGIYSWNIEAMTLNNLGAALMNLGRLDAASDRLQESLRVDSQYCVPYFNLAVVASLRGEATEARELSSRAEALGYSGTPVDRVIQRSQTTLASIEGRGEPRS